MSCYTRSSDRGPRGGDAPPFLKKWTISPIPFPGQRRSVSAVWEARNHDRYSDDENYDAIMAFLEIWTMTSTSTSR